MSDSDEVFESLWPFLAPLSWTFSKHLYEYFLRLDQPDQRSFGDLPTALQHERFYTDAQRDFYVRIASARQEVYARMSTADLSTDFFLAELQKAAPLGAQAVQAQTLSAWSKLRLVRKGFNKIAPHSFAEVLLTRIVDRRQKGWLPSSVPKEEAEMSVFYQAPANLYVDEEWIEQPVQVVPYPIPSDIEKDLAPAGLLWSPWEGLRRDGWVHANRKGAMRFVGQRVEFGRRHWNVTFQDLARWGAGSNTELGDLANSEESLQNLAHKTLLLLSLRKFVGNGTKEI